MNRQAVIDKRKDKIPYEYNKVKFKDYDPLIMSKNTGCPYSQENQEFTVTVMNTQYIVKYPSGDIYHSDYSQVIKLPIKTLILRYLINAVGVAPSNKLITYRDVPGGNVYYPNFYGRCIKRFEGTFKGKYNLFEKAALACNGIKVDNGDIAYKIEFINNVFMTFILWKGDDEFPTTSQVLFDGNVSFYFSAEDLAFVGDICMSALTNKAFN